MPVTVLVKLPGGSESAFTNVQGMSDIAALEKSIAALPNVQSVRSLVDPKGEGAVSDLLSPSARLAATAAGFRQMPSTDLNMALGDASLAAVKSTAVYVDDLAAAFPNLPATDVAAARADLAALTSGMVELRAGALVHNQLDAIEAKLSAIAAQSGAATSTTAAADTAAQLAALKSYLDELGVADPAVKSVSSYSAAEKAAAALAASSNPATFLQLLGSVRDLSTWFKAQPTAFYFSPTAMPATPEIVTVQKAVATARAGLPGELEALASAFAPTDLFASSDLRSAYVSGDGTVARLYVTTSTNPYDTASFGTIRDLRALLATDPGHFAVVSTAAPQAYVGGATAEFADVQDTISADFLRVAAITIIGILLVLILLLRALVAPIYLVLTVLLSYAMSLSVSALILQHLFGQAGMNYFIPLMVFVLLVALGSDYNIFLMSRVREESATRELREGIRVASARTGTVITSAGLILAGTFGALVTSPLQLLFQVGLAVALGVLIDTFVVRSLLVPAITAFIGERAWWPFHRRGA
jgi:RND superfamily putative drug exporter